MRFDTPIYFQAVQTGDYDPTTGNYKPDTVTEVMQYASVTHAGSDTLQLVYGTLKQGCLTLRLQNHYAAPFDHIRIGKQRYKVDRERTLRNKQTFVVSEVKGV